jgi:hypothetical protein
MHVVTISATYGAAGSVVGPAVAERLGVPFVDRAIPTTVADDLGISVEHALTRDEQVQSWITRWLAAAAPVSTEWMIGSDPPYVALLPDERILACTQQAIRKCTGHMGGVILGRAAAIVLRDHPTALHVRLDGDPERRVRQAMTLLGSASAKREMRCPATTTPAPPTCATSTAPTRRCPSTTISCWTAPGSPRSCAST